MKKISVLLISIFALGPVSGQNHINFTDNIKGADSVTIQSGWPKISDSTHISSGWPKTTGLYFLNRPNEIYRICSKYDTTVLNIGDVNCWHDWAGEPQTLSNAGCLVSHDDRGCLDSWLNRKFICVKCLRHVHVIETREVIKPQDRYTEALKRLQQ